MENTMCRCNWVPLNDPVYVAYHDEEWGRESHDDSYLFEMLLLECFQAGLSWSTILHKREAFRDAFDGFDAEKISQYNEEKIAELLQNSGIIRHRKKIEAAVNNAQIYLMIQKEFGTFDAYIWTFSKRKVVRNEDDVHRTTSPLSDAVSKDLKKRGMKFVGSTTIYSYLQAIGVINDHARNCSFR